MATATPSLVSIEEYLRCSEYEPDANYVDDHIEERPMGELDHSSLQGEISFLLNKRDTEHSFAAIESFVSALHHAASV